VNRKVLVLAVALMAVAMLAAPVMANRGQNMKEFKSYTLEGTLINSVIEYQELNFPIWSGYGTRAPDGVVECVITIDGVEYTYPEDFSYSEYWEMELNVVTGEGLLTVESVYTFNLPGKPAITEWIVTEIVGGEYNGMFQLTGTKMFNKVEGSGTETGIPGEGLAVTHVGLIKGWPFGE